MMHALFTPFLWSYNKLPRGAFSRVFAPFFCNTSHVQMTTPVKPVALLLLVVLSLLSLLEAPVYEGIAIKAAWPGCLRS